MKNTAPGRRIIGKILRRFPSYVLDTIVERMTRVIMDNTDDLASIFESNFPDDDDTCCNAGTHAVVM
jgi:hypothetical protein